MTNLIYHILFLVFTLFVLLKTIFYALYEINIQKNKIGGIGVIFFSVFITIFSNIIVFMK